jgi:hypothetical protein
METRLRMLAVMLLGLISISHVSIVWAVPPLPSSLYGTVKADGANPPSGTSVSAWIGGVKYAETLVALHGGDAVYSLNVPGDDPDTASLVEGGRVGDTITLRIGAQPAAQTAPWQNGTNLRLNLTSAPTPVPCPATPVLDSFNRANGRLGTSNWAGNTGTSSYTIASNRVDVAGGGPLYWKPTSFGTNQEAYVTLTTVDPRGREQDLLLKVQAQGNNPDWRRGVIEVLYDAPGGVVRVETFRPGGVWVFYPAIPVTFQNGDRLGARALSNGTVQVFKNCSLVGTVTLNTADQSFFNGRGGRIGLWFINAGAAFFDDFGGGTLNLP